MQCKQLEAVLESEGLSPLPPEAREHLAGCLSCQDLLSDLSTIAVTAKDILAEVAPPERVWVSLRAQLEAEGIIRDTQPVALPAPAHWWSGFAGLFRPRALATVGAALFVVFSSVIIVVERRSSTNPAKPHPELQMQASQTRKPVTAPIELKPPAPAKSLPQPTHSALVSPAPVSQTHPSSTVLRRSPSEEAYLGDSAALLSQTENSLPRRELANNATVDASLRQNLRTLNGFIAECEARLKQNPQDQLTREYLNMAYQQKAELLTAMMDNGRSDH
jgi:hypothetical protein